MSAHTNVYFMNDAEEMAARGRMMTEYVEAKRRLVTLRAEAKRIGDLLTYAGACIQHERPHKSASIGAEHFEAMDAERIKRLLADIEKTDSRVIELQKQLTELGLL